jgi:hypothetical protein
MPERSGANGVAHHRRHAHRTDSYTVGQHLDDWWAPHRYGQRPSYYLTEPAFDDATYREIEAAYNQVVAGTKRLIELAVGRPVKLWHGLNYVEPRHFMGICAGLEWEYEHK